MIDDAAMRAALLESFPHLDPGRFEMEEFEHGDIVGASYRDGVKRHSCRVDARGRDTADIHAELERAVASWWPDLLAEYDAAHAGDQGPPARRYVASHEPAQPVAPEPLAGPVSMLNAEAMSEQNRYLAIEIAPDGSIARWATAGKHDAEAAEQLRTALEDVKFTPLEAGSDASAPEVVPPTRPPAPRNRGGRPRKAK